MTTPRTATSQLGAVLFAALLGMCPLAARAADIPHSEREIPFAARVHEQLGLAEANPEELLAGALAQYNYFFPAGVGTPVSGRAQLDALEILGDVAISILLRGAPHLLLGSATG